MYVPISLLHFYRKKFNEKKNKELVLALEKARMKITPVRFIAAATFYSLLALIPGTLLGYIVASKLSLIFNLNLLIITLLIVIFATISFLLTRYSILSYPFYLSSIRAKNIDLYLLHATNTMLGIVKGGGKIGDALKFIADNKHLFGELSKEFEKVVTLIEHGKDLSSALRYVAETTPSERLRSFLENLVNVYEGGGNLAEYLKSRSEQLLNEKEITYSTMFETLQLFSEIYLALFVVFPLFLLIVLIVFQMLGKDVLQTYRYMIFLLIPAGSILIIYFIRSSIPFEKKVVEVQKKTELPILTAISKKQSEFKILRFFRIVRKIKSFLAEPFRKEVYELKLRSLLFYFLLPPIIFFYFFHHLLEIDFALFLSLILLFVPLVFFIEYKNYIIRKMENELPSLLRQMANLNDAGLNIVEILKHLSEAEVGVLSKEVKTVKREIEWGELVTEAFRKLERRIMSSLFGRVLSILVKSIEFSTQIRDALAISASYSELEVLMHNRVRRQMFMYVVIVYLAFAIFLYTVQVLINNMFSIVANLELQAAMFTIDVNIQEIKTLFLETTILVAIFSGLVAGVFSEGKIESGMKHIFIFMVTVYVFYKFLIY
ncbi:MAG: type II secretion system F family protein [Archaeoglobaceae archaeon]|nr:type II secretion system F family protein [Archaeoglobaceae archaeon]MCX8152388.1 type II secretion system F family protein [Archaeoglobaceae archaeon]MDW8013728.1 type II secretion system F family protein [Archaeoglobaceae archaeon]